MTRPENISQEEGNYAHAIGAAADTNPTGTSHQKTSFTLRKRSGRSVRTRSSTTTLAPLDENPELKLRKAAAQRERIQREVQPSAPLEATGLTPSVQLESVALSRMQVEPQEEGSTLTEKNIKALTVLKTAVES